jgi:O-Antigen ligase
MEYFNQLITFLFTPLGFVISTFLIFVLIQPASSRTHLQWWVITILGFATSLGKFSNEWGVTSPPLAFPLEEMREFGRPLSALLLLTCLGLALRSHKGWRKDLLPKPILYLLLFQSVIVLKTILYGSISFALLTLVLYASVVLSISLGVSQWLQNDRDFTKAVYAIALVAVLFILANLYQASIDIEPIIFIHGWFSGTTGNPNHAAFLLTTSLPCIIFLQNQSPSFKWENGFWLAVLGLCIFGLVITASRTGMISSFVAILLLFRGKTKRFIAISMGLVLFWLVVTQFIQPLSNIDTFSATTNKIAKFQNTRAEVWQALWQTFLRYPFLGVPLQNDRFFGYGESSWLGGAAATGLLGLIPLLLTGLECLKMMWRLDRLSLKYPQNYWKYSVVISGLGGILTGSLAEAYLLGNITFVLLGFFLYLTLGTYLVEQSRSMNLALSPQILSPAFPPTTAWNR